MKIENLFLLLMLIVLVLPSDTNKTEEVTNSIPYHTFSAEGMVAIQVADVKVTFQKVDETEENSVKKCNCVNGMVPTPDGVSKMPCKCGIDCPCPKQESETKVNVDDLGIVSLDRQILMFTKKTCDPCNFFKRTQIPILKSRNWIIGSDVGHLREIDVEENPEIYRKYANGHGFPCFVKLKGRRAIEILDGYKSANTIIEMYTR